MNEARLLHELNLLRVDCELAGRKDLVAVLYDACREVVWIKEGYEQKPESEKSK